MYENVLRNIVLNNFLALFELCGGLFWMLRDIKDDKVYCKFYRQEPKNFRKLNRKEGKKSVETGIV
ncbi:hypothetical protein NECAME_19480 [Necator americanus]|uniref:Uncharacterized protein n=1 Tax=Necator americanus TaxID=51031 RepID=W2SKD6_NECAM|nr:hypothetical protein NECAME_19480 [Necator americanus]ETN69202.1 hypothetical protein NECAME_19480 [Necator americanus]